MSDYDIPDEYINDVHFIHILTTALNSEYEQNENLLKNYTARIKLSKATVTKEIANRKNVKQQIEINKERKINQEPLLEHLSRTECERMTNLTLLKKRLDERSLRTKENHEVKYMKILDKYRETWNKYQAEYEEFELAVIRNQRRIQLKQLKVKIMISEQKKIEYQKMLKQKEKINKKRIQSVIVSSSKMILDRWQKQKYADILNNTKIKDSLHELKKITEKYNEIVEYLRAEEKKKALERQLMPVPRLNFSLVQSLYVDKNSRSQPMKENKYRKKRAVDLDTVSVNTVMFEEMCNNEENITIPTLETDEQEKEDDNESSPSPNQPMDSETNVTNNHNIPLEVNVTIIERACSQLSMDDETCKDSCHETADIKRQSTSELNSKPELSQQNSTEQIINPLKHKLSSSESIDKNEEHQKRIKVDEQCEHSLSPVGESNLLCDEKCVSQKNSSVEKENSTAVKTDSMPQIKKIETITRPITIQTKPPMAEVTPTPSSLFSPRYYAPSYASSTNLSHFIDNNYNNDAVEGISEMCDLDNYSGNWQNMSPPRPGSEISFSSANVSVKDSAPKNNRPNFLIEPQKPAAAVEAAPNFFDFFSCGTTNPKSLF